MQAKATVISVALLIAGNAVGAGILGVPVKCGAAGLIPSLAGMAAIWAVSLLTGWIIAKGILADPEERPDIPSLIQKELGGFGKWLAVAGYLTNYYGIMVAYLAGGAAVLSGLLGASYPAAVCLLAFFIPTTATALFGLSAVRKGNLVFMVFLAASFVLMITLTSRGVQAERFLRADWGFFPATLPVLLCSMAYHNIVPSACRSLGWDKGRVRAALVIGTLIPLVFTGAWTVSVIGALPLSGAGQGNLTYALQESQPATVALAAALNSPAITISGLAFALCALVTSYLGCGASLMGFMDDLLASWRPARKRWLRGLIVFAPPFFVALAFPDIFLVMLDVAGGFGVGVVFGICPALILLKWGKGAGRAWGWLLLALFAGLMALEAAQEAGLLHLSPSAEHWNIKH